MSIDNFRVVLDRKESINSLSEKAASGMPVSKTPHVGNWRPDNMTWVDEHILNIAYDRTVGRKDKNFHPHGIIYQGVFKESVNVDILSTHSELTDVHMQALKTLFPHAKIDTFTDWLHMHKGHIKTIIDILGEKSIELGIWNRFVDEEGKIYKKTPVSYKSIMEEGIFNINNDDRGWIWSNEFNVILLSVIDSIIHDSTDEVWHVSGPDMYNYIGKMHDRLQQIYMNLAGHNGIPKSLTMHLHVAGFYNRFTVPQSKKEELDQFFEAVSEYMIAKEEKVGAYKRKSRGEKVNVQEYAKKEKCKFEALIDAVGPLKNILFYKMYREKNGMPKKIYPSYFSQYDALDAGAVYTHQKAREMSSSEIEDIYKVLLKAEVRIKNK